MPNQPRDVYALVATSTTPSGADDGFEDGSEVELQALRVRALSREIKIDPDDFRERWRGIVELVQGMFTQSDESSDDNSGLGLESITAELTLAGKGKLAFLAEASASASITAVFKRQGTG